MKFLMHSKQIKKPHLLIANTEEILRMLKAVNFCVEGCGGETVVGGDGMGMARGSMSHPRNIQSDGKIMV